MRAGIASAPRASCVGRSRGRLRHAFDDGPELVERIGFPGAPEPAAERRAAFERSGLVGDARRAAARVTQAREPQATTGEPVVSIRRRR